jgi:DNA recombination protein RmuC
MNDVVLIVDFILTIAALVLLLVLVKKSSQVNDAAIFSRLDAFDKAQERIERTVREEVAQNRDELGKAAKEQRQELAEAFKTFGDSTAQSMRNVADEQRNQLASFAAQLSAFAKASGERMDGFRAESAASAKQLREEVLVTLKGIAETTTKTMTELAGLQKSQLESMTAAIGKLSESNVKKLDEVRVAVENKLQNMQLENAKQLDQMRQTVDEKLQGTLEKRLGESFKQVSERLEMVHKGLGEMQTLAAGVGDLKKVLTNVKTRGTWGEVQLGMLLEQVLNPEQFDANVSTKDNGERVEFAVKLPGQSSNKDEIVWLPIDAKFPLEDYQRLLEAQERADAEAVEAAGKQLENRVKACAWDIFEKYLNPPKTTDFGILFLPVEGLFAEVVRRIGLAETIQRECRVVLAGPTTLWSILNSLQMGFRTLAIQRRSSEVWNLLGAVKTEWTKYGDVLDAVQRKLHQASETIEKAQVRSRAVGRKLKDVQELPVGEAAAMLPNDSWDGAATNVDHDDEEET